MDYSKLLYQLFWFLAYCLQEKLRNVPMARNEIINVTTSNVIQNNCKVEKMLDENVAQSCVSIVEKHMTSVEELKNGRASFDSKVLSNYQWEYSSTYLIAKTKTLEQEIRTLANAKDWSHSFADKVINFAQLTVKDEYMKITFTTESKSKLELSIIASYKDDENGIHYIKVMKVENTFTLAPEAKDYILEVREPIYVKLTSKSGFLGWYSESEEVFHSGDKVEQRIEKVVSPQNIFAGEFANMHKYMVYKVCRNTARQFLDSLNVEAGTKSMMEWNDSD